MKAGRGEAEGVVRRSRKVGGRVSPSLPLPLLAPDLLIDQLLSHDPSGGPSPPLCPFLCLFRVRVHVHVHDSSHVLGQPRPCRAEPLAASAH